MAYQPNQKRDHIRELQRYLHGISYFNTAVPHIAADGIYGKETAMAVRAFQQQYGLRPTGETNRATWDAVIQQYRILIERPATKLDVFPGGQRMIGKGDIGFPVYVVQAMLQALRLRFDNLLELSVDGKYGEQTQCAVMAFQRENGLKPTGETDRFTWNLLAAAANVMTTA